MELERQDAGILSLETHGTRILRFFRILVRLLIVVLVGLVSAVTAMRFAIHGREVQVPNLVGVAPAEAARRAQADGLATVIENRFYSPQVPEGRILSQLPPPGTVVRRGWDVRLAESLGPQRVAIPSVVGESMRAAEINLKRRGLELGPVVTTPLPGIEAGLIAAQSPPADAVGILDPKVGLLVADTPDPAFYVMPGFVGEPLDEAVKKVQSSGFTLGKINRLPPSSTAGEAASASLAPGKPVSRVIRQDPAAGKKIPAGATIQFDVE